MARARKSIRSEIGKEQFDSVQDAGTKKRYLNYENDVRTHHTDAAVSLFYRLSKAFDEVRHETTT